MSLSLEPRAAVSFEDEPLICVDANDNVIGHASKAVCHDGVGVLHRAFSVFLFNARGELLLQQRSAKKRLWPLWWANTCCSHPRRGEQTADAAVRRVREELGLRAELTFTHEFTYHASYGAAGSEHERCSVFVGRAEAEPVVHPQEVAAVRWVPPAEMDAVLAEPDGPYTPWLRLEWQALRQTHWQLVEALRRG